ncbi:hypothetical protein DL96DRAFT_1605202 [Flagelloscypha sp. PMI_526]|nr:hypothetical protein DL96DRAFT_1605202 [Flagelloscypha sp. PMI_526]
MAVLVTGATGMSSVALLKVLKSEYSSVEAICASRQGVGVQGFPGVIFDWTDDATYENPWKVNPKIRCVHIVGPPAMDMLKIVEPFLVFAMNKSVKRFTFVSGALANKGDPVPHGKVHEWLAEQPNIEYAVIRPSGFFENFVTQNYRVALLRDEDKIISNYGDGICAWVAADDIGKAIARAITEEKACNGEYIVLGPEGLTNDQIAAIFSEVLARKITHVSVSGEEFTKQLLQRGVEQHFAVIGAMVGGAIAQGMEQSKTKGFETIVGKMTLREFIEANKQVWIPEK